MDHLHGPSHSSPHFLCFVLAVTACHLAVTACHGEGLVLESTLFCVSQLLPGVGAEEKAIESQPGWQDVC